MDRESGRVYTTAIIYLDCLDVFVLESKTFGFRLRIYS